MKNGVRRAVIVGASSGIGRALARELAADGYELGLAARREEKLREVAAELPVRCVIRGMDVAEADSARTILAELVDELGGLDLIVLNAGVGYSKPTWDQERETVEVNVLGFTALATWSMEYFLERGVGHLVGISSVSALRGAMVAPAYGASKSYISNYLEAMRLLADRRGADVAVTDVKPGFVDTPMTEDRTDMFWVAPVEKAARQIATAIRKRKRLVYVTKRWRLLAWLLKVLPYPLLARMMGA